MHFNTGRQGLVHRRAGRATQSVLRPRRLRMRRTTLHSPRLLTILGHLQVQRVTLLLDDLFRDLPVDLGHRMIISVTHLDLFNTPIFESDAHQLPLLPALTHLKLNSPLPPLLPSRILAECPTLQVFVCTWSKFSWSRYRARMPELAHTHRLWTRASSLWSYSTDTIGRTWRWAHEAGAICGCGLKNSLQRRQGAKLKLRAIGSMLLSCRRVRRNSTKYLGIG
ncbi:hypothetical protein C8J57DRAFT_1281017 [Mycena rebaudengoi]|nr:hypothetical protein C8J57DRAFT_1281017 [Mycena rebaudengoi]